MTEFVDIDATIDPQAIGDGAVDALTQTFANQGHPGWTPSDGALEIILLYILAVWAADCAQLAAQTRLAVFRSFGTKLMNLPYDGGAAATGTSRWALADTAGHTIEGGTYLTVAGQGFYVQADVVIPAPGAFTATTSSGSATLSAVSSFASIIVGTAVSGTGIPNGTTVTAVNAAGSSLTMSANATSSNVAETVTAATSQATVAIIAVDQGTDYNGLTAPVELVEQISWVTAVTVAVATSGGADAETDDAYTTRLAGLLALQAPRPITASDYSTFTLSVPSTVVPAGVVVGRTTALDGYSPVATPFTATTSSGSATLTVVSSFSGVTAGSVVSGTGIPAGTTVLSINTGASTLVMSANATATGSAVTVTSTGSYGNSRTITVFVTDKSGNALSAPAMTAIQAWLSGYREVNFVVAVVAPSYSTIYVTAQIHVLAGYTSASVVSNVQAALLAYLSPAQWGNPSLATSGATRWLNSGDGFNVVRVNKAIGIIEAVQGVDYVAAGGLKLGTAPSPSGTSDITMPGPAPLPQADISTPTIVVTTV